MTRRTAHSARGTSISHRLKSSEQGSRSGELGSYPIAFRRSGPQRSRRADSTSLPKVDTKSSSKRHGTSVVSTITPSITPPKSFGSGCCGLRSCSRTPRTRRSSCSRTGVGARGHRWRILTARSSRCRSFPLGLPFRLTRRFSVPTAFSVYPLRGRKNLNCSSTRGLLSPRSRRSLPDFPIRSGSFRDDISRRSPR